jgi:hypothetical protein
MLAAVSTFIFPAGLQAPAAAAGNDPDEQEMGGSSSTQAVQLGGSSAHAADWDNWQQPGQMGQVPATRHTTSAPGYSSSKAGEAVVAGVDGLLGFVTRLHFDLVTVSVLVWCWLLLVSSCQRRRACKRLRLDD